MHVMYPEPTAHYRNQPASQPEYQPAVSPARHQPKKRRALSPVSRHAGPDNTGYKGKHTSNLKCHLASRHLPEYSEVINVNKSNQASRLSGETSSKSEDENRVENLKGLCMQLIAVHGRPLALVSDDPFRKILKLAAAAPKVTAAIDLNAQSQIKEINEKSVRASIPETAYQIKLKIASEIREKLISLKVDSATCSERKFFGVNIQYLNNDKVIVRNLAVAEIFQCQTAEFLKEKLLEILSDFYISTDQIYSLTTDNGSNMKKMVKLLKGTYYSEDIFEDTTSAYNSDFDISSDEEEDDQLNELSEESANFELTLLQNAVSNNTYKVRGMLCAAHTLQLAIKDAIDANVEIQVTLQLARKIAKILRSPTNRNLLKIAHLKVPIIDCATRWTSKYDMLVRLQSLQGFCENINETSILTSDEFWEEIEQIITCLKPLYECTLILQREQLTVGDFYIQWMNCKSKVSNTHHAFATSLLTFMQLREKTLLENDVVLEALYLDGRVNVMLSSEQSQRAKILLKETRIRLQQYKNTLQVDSDTDMSDRNRTSLDQGIQIESQREIVPSSSTHNEFAALEQLLLQSERVHGRHQLPVSSFDVCLQNLQTVPRIPLGTDIIGHWSNMSTMHSELAMVARTVLATPVTQVSVERMFSSLKFILSPLRTNLGSSLLQQMLLIRANKDLLQ